MINLSTWAVFFSLPTFVDFFLLGDVFAAIAIFSGHYDDRAPGKNNLRQQSVGSGDARLLLGLDDNAGGEGGSLSSSVDESLDDPWELDNNAPPQKTRCW